MSALRRNLSKVSLELADLAGRVPDPYSYVPLAHSERAKLRALRNKGTDFRTWKAGQEESLTLQAQGGDVLVLSGTGAGKTLSMQLAVFHAAAEQPDGPPCSAYFARIEV
jgi:ATP-dependent helicase YprA (DUF1998 family)